MRPVAKKYPNKKTFIKNYGDIIKGKNLIFYCIVGERSSHFLKRINKYLLKDGITSFSNLRGGIFRWYNEKNPVVDATGETDAIHPFNKKWGALIIRRNR